jgi:UDP-N-acetyl-D-mannosaminouronate:lipid I N-acetyl-D-mannosaminouronosyltransferase
MTNSQTVLYGIENTLLNGVKTWSFNSRQQLVDFAFKTKKILVALNAEKILHANDKIREIINENIGYADGIGTVWALKKKGFKDAVKIPGRELWLDIIRSSYHEKSFYLVGGKQEVIEQTVVKLKTEFPEIRIVNFRNGYISGEKEKTSLIIDIKTRQPDVVFVAIGSPKQELLMGEMMQIYPAIYQGLGGSFDVYIMSVPRAPEWWVKNNLEWAYRLIKQPSRIKRQIHLLRFLWLLLVNKI